MRGRLPELMAIECGPRDWATPITENKDFRISLAGCVETMMGEPVSRASVQSFYEALASRDPLRLAPHLADDVEWLTVGPAEIFSFCGYRRGKAAVLDYIGRLMPATLAIKRFEPADIVIDGDTAAIINNVAAVRKDNGRILSYQTAIFVVFSDGKAVSVKGLADTFDMAEQVVGHRIDAISVPDRQVPKDVIAL
jgi:ketosteroid isomerase-like protein